jgi:hypothetical protein
VYLHDTGGSVEDMEFERVEDEVGAKPNVLAAPGFQLWAEGARKVVPDR